MAQIPEAIDKAKQSVGYFELKEYQRNTAEAYLSNRDRVHSHKANKLFRLFQVIHKHGGPFSYVLSWLLCWGNMELN